LQEVDMIACPIGS